MAERLAAAGGTARIAWLASFPKSGNTWMRILIGNLVIGGDAARIDPIGLISSDRATFEGVTGLSTTDLTPDEIDLLRPDAYRRIAAASGQDPLFVKAHDAYACNRAGDPLFPTDCARGAVLIVRHPMDVALSLAHHLGHADCESAVRRLCSPDHVAAGAGTAQFHQRTMGWSNHYLSWTRQAAIPVRVVRYEDMLADTVAALGRIADFLGLEGSADPERLAAAARASRFERLQSIEAREGFGEIAPDSERFFRAGRAGEGVAALPAHLRETILAHHKPVMEELGYSPSGADPAWRPPR